jgi:O6-methylguanine-DNA--protein-cysteine methyltransferase
LELIHDPTSHFRSPRFGMRELYKDLHIYARRKQTIQRLGAQDAELIRTSECQPLRTTSDFSKDMTTSLCKIHHGKTSSLSQIPANGTRTVM